MSICVYNVCVEFVLCVCFVCALCVICVCFEPTLCYKMFLMVLVTYVDKET